MNDMESNITYQKIGEVAEKLGTTTRTLRFYEEQGLLSPARSKKGTRLYSQDDVERFRVILRLVDLGLPLRTVAQLAKARPDSQTGGESSRRIHQLLLQLQDRVEQKQRECEAMLHDLEEASSLVQECFDCASSPSTEGCDRCPVTRNVDRSHLLHLVWGQSGIGTG